MKLLKSLLDGLPEDLGRKVFTHDGWGTEPAPSYKRLALVGDNVLGVAVMEHLYTNMDPKSFGVGKLTEIRSQAVSERSCRKVAARLGVPALLASVAPEKGGAATARALSHSELCWHQ